MVQTIVDLFDFFMLAAFFCAITICVILYLGRNSVRALMIGIYFVVQTLLELVIRLSEVDTPLTRWWNRTFTSSVSLKGLCYTVVIVSMLLVVLFMLEIPVQTKHFVIPAVICVCLTAFPLIQYHNMIYYGMCLVPCEMYYFGLAIYALRKLKDQPRSKLFDIFRYMMITIAVFAVIIFAEDMVTSWNYGFYTEFKGFTNPSLGIAYIKERSFSESTLQLILAGAVIYVGGRLLVSTLRANLMTTPVNPVTISDSPVSNDLDGFADEIGLSTREREVLPLLLDNQSMQQISEALFISPGTVKYHTHNVYQKAGVSDRAQLIKKAADFRAGI